LKLIVKINLTLLIVLFPPLFTTALLDKRKWPTTWQEQFRVLAVRGLKERRHEAFAGLRVGQVLAISIICGLLWWQTSTDRIQDQVGLLFCDIIKNLFIKLFI